MTGVVAYRTELWGIVSIVKAESRSKAKAATVRAANDAGYDVAFTAPVSVRRAPEFDCVDAPAGRIITVSCARWVSP